jgi:hypothetical protein
MNCPDFIKMWAINNDQTKFVKKVGVNGYIHYNKTRKLMVVQSRDFVTNMIQNTEPDGSVIYCCSSIGCDYDFPTVKDTVRGTTPISGVIITPNL